MAGPLPRRLAPFSFVSLLLFSLVLLHLCACLAQAAQAAAAADNHHHRDNAPPPPHKAEVADEDENDLDLSKADVEELGLKNGHPLRKELADAHGDDLAASLSDVGLTDKELAELKQMERDSQASAPDIAVYHGRKDKRMVDAAPPPGMVAPPAAQQQQQQQQQKQQRVVGRQVEHAPPPPPHEPKDDVAEKERKAAEARAEAGRKEAEALQAKIALLTRSLEAQKDDAKAAKLELSRSTQSFDRKLEEQRQEHKSEREELSGAIEERKRAFDELYEEKQVLGQILNEEQQALHELQEKIQHPDLGLWIRQRAERAAILVETPETDAMKFYARKYMAPKVTKMRHRLALLEKRVEKSVDHLLPAKYGSMVAFLLTIGLIGFPVFVTMSTVVSVTKSVSLRQYVLLGNVFLTAFSSGLCIAGLILQQDPLQTLYEASESLFVILQLAAAVVFPVFVGVIFCAVLKSRDQEDLFVFGCELVFYVLVGLNYRARVWRPAMLGQNIETSRMMYVVYVIDFLSMTALTISSAKLDQSRLPSFVGDSYTGLETEDGQAENKAVGGTGSGSLAGARAGFGALGSGLMKAAMSGDNSGGKEE